MALAIAIAILRVAIHDLGYPARRAPAKRFLLHEYFGSVWDHWMISIGISIRRETMVQVIRHHSKKQRRHGFRPARVTRPDEQVEVG